MKLWIRSQDRTDFSECDGIHLMESNPANKKKTTYGIIANCSCVGEYRTRERCLEIIDEIQAILCRSGMILFKDIDITNLSPKDIEPFKAINWCSSPVANEKSEVTVHNAVVVVYEMPQE